MAERERGVSDVVSFVLVFSLVVTTVGIVYASGFAGLDAARSAERVDNAVRAFDVLADNMEDIHRRRAPSRKTEIKLADASLTYSATTTEIDVTVEGVGDGSGNLTHHNAEITPIVYDAGTGTVVVYEGGAVIRRDGDYARMLREPPFLVADDRMVLQYVETISGGRSAGGSGTVLVRGERTRSELLVTESDSTAAAPLAVTVNVTAATERAGAWARYLESRPDVACGPIVDVGDGRSRVSCAADVTELAVSVTSVELGLS